MLRTTGSLCLLTGCATFANNHDPTPQLSIAHKLKLPADAIAGNAVLFGHGSHLAVCDQKLQVTVIRLQDHRCKPPTETGLTGIPLTYPGGEELALWLPRLRSHQDQCELRFHVPVHESNQLLAPSRTVLLPRIHGKHLPDVVFDPSGSHLAIGAAIIDLESPGSIQWEAPFTPFAQMVMRHGGRTGILLEWHVPDGTQDDCRSVLLASRWNIANQTIEPLAQWPLPRLAAASPSGQHLLLLQDDGLQIYATDPWQLRNRIPALWTPGERVTADWLDEDHLLVITQSGAAQVLTASGRLHGAALQLGPGQWSSCGAQAGHLVTCSRDGQIAVLRWQAH